MTSCYICEDTWYDTCMSAYKHIISNHVTWHYVTLRQTTYVNTHKDISHRTISYRATLYHIKHEACPPRSARRSTHPSPDTKTRPFYSSAWQARARRTATGPDIRHFPCHYFSGSDSVTKLYEHTLNKTIRPWAYAYTWKYKYICIYVYIYTCTYTCTDADAEVHSNIQVHIRIHTDVDV